MPISFVVKSSLVSPEWVDYTDNTYWVSGVNSQWDGSKWVPWGPPGSIDMYVNTGGGHGDWSVGFRPTKIRVTGTVQWTTDILLSDGNYGTGGTEIFRDNNGAIVEYDLNWTSASDMESLYLYGYSEVTKIEFL